MSLLICGRIDLLHKSHCAPVSYPTIHCFVTVMCASVHNSVTNISWGICVKYCENVRWVYSTTQQNDDVDFSCGFPHSRIMTSLFGSVPFSVIPGSLWLWLLFTTQYGDTTLCCYQAHLYFGCSSDPHSQRNLTTCNATALLMVYLFGRSFPGPLLLA